MFASRIWTVRWGRVLPDLGGPETLICTRLYGELDSAGLLHSTGKHVDFLRHTEGLSFGPACAGRQFKEQILLELRGSPTEIVRHLAQAA